MSQFRLVFVVFYFTAVLIFAVYLRSTNNRIFYDRCRYSAEENLLNQKLGAKQLLLERLINPAAISERLGEPDGDD